MNGLLVINKPKGITSFDCIRKLRKITGVKKIGHTGTLDPMASGVMLLLFGTATKKAAEFSKLDKDYVAEITLGSTSTTGDAEGEIAPINDIQPTLEQVQAALEQFKGEITQTPSIYSAIKIDGQEAYKRARRGESIDMPSRQVTVHRLELVNYDYPRLDIDCSVSSGTYIRSLAEDIGDVLGTGAHLTKLVRTKVGDYIIDQAVELDADIAKLESNLQALEI